MKPSEMISPKIKAKLFFLDSFRTNAKRPIKMAASQVALEKDISVKNRKKPKKPMLRLNRR